MLLLFLLDASLTASRKRDYSRNSRGRHRVRLSCSINRVKRVRDGQGKLEKRQLKRLFHRVCRKRREVESLPLLLLCQYSGPTLRVRFRRGSCCWCCRRLFQHGRAPPLGRSMEEKSLVVPDRCSSRAPHLRKQDLGPTSAQRIDVFRLRPKR